MSIKGKIALLNTVLVTIVMVFVLLFMMSISHSLIQSTTLNQLKEVVHENVDEVEWEGGQLELDDVDFYENHVTTLIYSEEGVLLGGYLSDLEQFTAPLIHGEVTPFTLDGVSYLIYDYLATDRRYGSVYVRGVVSVAEMSETVEQLFYLTLLSLPLFILITGFGSYFIAKGSMKPLDKMVDTAKEIGQGSDLSRRINLGKGKNELHHLGETFDGMFGRLEEAFLSERQFSSDVSHELRTPTAVILAECECSLTEKASPQDKTEALEIIQRQAKQMQRLITALLNLIRLDGGVYKENFEEVDLSELVAMVCEEQETLLQEGQTLPTQIPEGLTCQGDYSLLIRVLSNLITNGFTYGKEGGYVQVTLEDKGDTLLLSVSDNGIGIPEGELGRIFNRFYQVDTARKGGTSESMGLGLSMVAQIIKLHHGTVEVESVLGEGTTFKVSLPC